MPANPHVLTAPALTGLADELAAFPALVSVWCGPVATRPAGADMAGPAGADVAGPAGQRAVRPLDADVARPAGMRPAAYSRLSDARHYAASMMKVPVLAAMYRLADAGALDLDEPIAVVNDFGSAHGGAPNFAMDPAYDQDDEVWARLDGDATPRWLGRRMIVRSSNLATNLLLARVGIAAVSEVLRDVGMDDSRVERGITDTAGRMAGFDNLTSARDLAALFAAIAAGAASRDSTLVPIATQPSCQQMIDVLCAQQQRDDLAAGTPSRDPRGAQERLGHRRTSCGRGRIPRRRAAVRARGVYDRCAGATGVRPRRTRTDRPDRGRELGRPARNHRRLTTAPVSGPNRHTYPTPDPANQPNTGGG